MNLSQKICRQRNFSRSLKGESARLTGRASTDLCHSGVLPDSLHRSRQKWLSEGIFEKYWTKPVKKKGVVEQPANNPSKDSMTKLGTCTITVEPHIFEASMFAIKDPNPRPPIPPASQPMYRPIIQYGPPGGMMPPPPPTPPLAQAKPVPPQPTPQPSPRSQDVHMKNTSPAPAVANLPGPSNGALPNGHPPQATPSHPQHTPAATAPAAAPPPAAPGKSTDPVIQMLAERAATDPDLKALMRIVANGEATPEELKKFQSHIDELTRIQKARQAAAQASQPPAQPPLPQPSVAPAPTANGHPTARPAPTPAATPAPPARNTPAPTPPAARPDPQYQPQPQALRSKGPLPSAKPDISGVVFEFTGGSGDRYLFPKFSILEYLPQGQVIASFLIVRKGSSSDSPVYDPELDYYQPITIRLYAHQGRQLEALQKVVAPQDEVRRYMDEIMDKTTRAEYVLLAMRLPRDTDQAPAAERDDEAEKADQMDTNPLWPTTNPTPIARVKPAKKLITEEESHQAFINSVAAVIE
jgi:hypothetical protein